MDTRDHDIELAVVRQAQEGQRESLSKLLRRVGDLMFVYVYWLTLDRHMAEELAQDAMLHVLRHINTLRIDNLSAFWTWTYRATLERVLGHRRTQQPAPSAVPCGIDPNDMTLHEAVGPAETPEPLAGRELTASLSGAMAALKFEYRHVLVLRSLGKMHYGQMALILGITNLEARWLVFRAKRSLKRQLTDRQFEKNHLAATLHAFRGAKAEPCRAGCVAPVGATPNHPLAG